MAGIIFLFLWKIRKKITIPGMIFFIYLTLNGIERFLIEKIRVNTKYDILGGITQAEIIEQYLPKPEQLCGLTLSILRPPP